MRKTLVACDKCGSPTEGYTTIVYYTPLYGSLHSSTYDLCRRCANAVYEFVNVPLPKTADNSEGDD